MATYIDGTMLFGSLGATQPVPRLIDAPAGSRVRLRFRNDEVWKAFIRHANGDFSAWYLEWADKEQNTIKLWYPFAQNARRRG